MVLAHPKNVLVYTYSFYVEIVATTSPLFQIALAFFLLICAIDFILANFYLLTLALHAFSHIHPITIYLPPSSHSHCVLCEFFFSVDSSPIKTIITIFSLQTKHIYGSFPFCFRSLFLARPRFFSR